MRRPWHIWLVFVVCLAVALGAMGWISVTALRLDRTEAEVQRDAALEENVRLALWRMDAALAPIIARENARSRSEYSAFYPAQQAYSKMFTEIQKGEVLVPSPLLAGPGPLIRLHFQFGPDGVLSSPQAPAGNMQDLAETGYATHEAITAAAERLTKFGGLVTRQRLLELLPENKGAEGARGPSGVGVLAALADAALAQDSPPGQQQAQQQGQQQQAQQQQAQRNEAEWDKRRQVQESASKLREVARGPVPERMLPIWIGGDLLLARRVAIGGQDVVQGCWLDWPGIRSMLRNEVKDLLPQAEVLPDGAPQEHAKYLGSLSSARTASGSSGNGEGRMLASLPLRLMPGPVPYAAADELSPVRLALYIAWACVALATAAVGVLLYGAISLSERRGAFVSAVTHEMRTPLTTFRMYAEMLAEGMVPDESSRKRYLDTLRTEADRLGHLVENVLAYARLERGPGKSRMEPVAVRDLFERMTGRLTQRAEQAGMTLAIEADAARLDLLARTDPSAVEQILFNLVDNASKYAACAEDRTIHVEVGAAPGSIVVCVRDHGPGISHDGRRRLFQPFRKSASDAAHTAPGVGLGLALCRRLARRLGGELVLDPGVTDGACFRLTLPVASPAADASGGKECE